MRTGNPIFLRLALSLSFVPLLGQAQSTVNFGAGVGERNVQDVFNQPLTDNNSVWVGVFDAGFDVSAASDDLNALNAAWNLLTKDTIETIFGNPGLFGGEASNLDPTFDNSQIWFWIFQTSDNSTPDVGFGDVTGYGLFSGTGSEWYLPPQGLAFPEDTTFVSSDMVNMAYHGSFDNNHLILQPIPEPSTVGLIILGLGCLTFHVWRRKPANPFQK